MSFYYSHLIEEVTQRLNNLFKVMWFVRGQVNFRPFVTDSSVHILYTFYASLFIFDMSERGPGIIHVIILVWLNLEFQMSSCL